MEQSMTNEDKKFLAGVMTAEAENIQLQKDLIAALERINARLDGGTMAKIDPTGEVRAQINAVLAKVQR
jgi:hypothetical protein